MDDIDEADVRLVISGNVRAGKLHFAKSHGRFLMGPIPMPWLDAARALPGRAIHVAIEIWHWRFIKKSMSVKINLSRMGRFGVTRPTASRGLQALESAGLVRVERGPGRAPVVTIIEVQPKAGAAGHADD